MKLIILINITLDFEPSLIKSKKTMEKVRIVGFLFHHSQAIQRKLRNIGFLKKNNIKVLLMIY